MERALRKYGLRWEGRERIFYRWPEHRPWSLTERGGIAELQKLELQKTDCGHVVWLQVQSFTFGVKELTLQGMYKAVCCRSTYGKGFLKESNIMRVEGCLTL